MDSFCPSKVVGIQCQMRSTSCSNRLNQLVTDNFADSRCCLGDVQFFAQEKLHTKSQDKTFAKVICSYVAGFVFSYVDLNVSIYQVTSSYYFLHLHSCYIYT